MSNKRCTYTYDEQTAQILWINWAVKSVLFYDANIRSMLFIFYLFRRSSCFCNCLNTWGNIFAKGVAITYSHWSNKVVIFEIPKGYQIQMTPMKCQRVKWTKNCNKKQRRENCREIYPIVIDFLCLFRKQRTVYQMSLWIIFLAFVDPNH